MSNKSPLRATNGRNAVKKTTSARDIGFSVIIILVATLFAFALGEVFLRLKNSDMKNYDIEMWKYSKKLKRQSENPLLGHEHVPSSSAMLQSVNIRINEKGMRGAPITARKEREKTVLFIGSSITLGWGVPEKDTLTEVLQKRFRQENKLVSVDNAGIGNYNTVRYIERYLTKLTDLKPDILVVQYFVNDAEVLESGGGNWLLANSELAVTLWIAFNRVFKPSGNQSLIDHYKSVYDPATRGYKNMKASLKKLSTYASQHQISVVLAMTPDIHMLENYPFDFIHQDVENISKNLGFTFVDLLPGLSAMDSKNLWAMPGDPHPNSMGHKIMADAIYPVLDEMLF